MGSLIFFPVRVNGVGMRTGEPCLACWSLVSEFENCDGVLSAWCACDWPEDETTLENVEAFQSDLESPAR